MEIITSISQIPKIRNRPQRTLSLPEFQRYSRQLILPEVGRPGQENLVNSSVLVVGCGGIGCPVIQYLAAAGVGAFGLVDNDVVDTSNIQRQILHMESDSGKLKVLSAAETIKNLNSSASVYLFNLTIDSSNALEIVSQFDLVVDCTDNVATRYLLNDACFLQKNGRIPLVSGAALRWDGQITVYKEDSCCYRCVHPNPPAPESVTNCSDGGVIGAVCGVVGSIQGKFDAFLDLPKATEALKILAGIENSLCGNMIIYDGLRASTRTIRLRPKRPDCKLCGERKEIKELVDYVQFCGMSANDKDKNLDLLADNERINVTDVSSLKKQSAIIVDVRPEVQFKICSLPQTFNLPLKKIKKNPDLLSDLIKEQNASEVVFLCRKGNDSQTATVFWKDFTKESIKARDIKGGLYAWQEQIDSSFPLY